MRKSWLGVRDGNFPNARNVCYALGRYFAATSQPELALAAYHRDQEFSRARAGAAGHCRDHGGNGSRCRPPLCRGGGHPEPANSLEHYVLGSLLLHTDRIDRAIAALERAEHSVKDDTGVYYALGRAYARAGRKEEAAPAWSVFKRLTEERQRGARNELAMLSLRGETSHFDRRQIGLCRPVQHFPAGVES